MKEVVVFSWEDTIDDTNQAEHNTQPGRTTYTILVVRIKGMGHEAV
jgi:hypothetical protein